MKYESLTKYINIFKENPIEEQYEYEDVDEGFVPLKCFSRNKYVDEFANDVMQFVADNTDLDLYHYMEIIDTYEPGRKVSAQQSVEEDYLQKLDAKGLLAWIVSAVRAEVFKEGALYDSIKNGIVEKWLTRLNELDA